MVEALELPAQGKSDCPIWSELMESKMPPLQISEATRLR
jgi:hypothetical protein